MDVLHCCLRPPHCAGTLEPPPQLLTEGVAAEQEEEEEGDGGEGCSAAAGIQYIHPPGGLK